MPGMEPTYDLSNVWQQDVDQEFTFIANKGLVFWRKEQVDTMRICDTCLGNVIRAAGNVARYGIYYCILRSHYNCAIILNYRFEPIYQHDAVETKSLYAELRSEEQDRAILFKNLNLERTRRRVRELSIRALKKRRIQLLKVWFHSFGYSLRELR